jgi:hypothetical protein
MDMYFNFEEDKKVQEKVIKHKCPNCQSLNIKDISTYKSNGIFGPGSASWKITDQRTCLDCGIIFMPTKGNTMESITP